MNIEDLENDYIQMLNDICTDLLIYFIVPGGRVKINEQALIADLSETLKLFDKKGQSAGYITRRTSRDIMTELKNLHPAVIGWLETKRKEK